MENEQKENTNAPAGQGGVGIKLFIAVIIVLVIGAVMVFRFAGEPSSSDDVFVLCSNSMRKVFNAAIKRYQSISNDKITTTAGGSGELWSQMEMTGKGDIFISHDPFLAIAEKEGYITEWKPVARLEVVIAVAKGNPKNINSLDDLAKPGLRIGAGNQKKSTSGVLVNELLRKYPKGSAIRKNIRMESKGHQQRCTDVTMGTLDAAFVWNAIASNYKDTIEIINFSKPVRDEYVDVVSSATYGRSDLKNINVTVGLMKQGAKNPKVKKFYDFLTTKCSDLFTSHGFSPLKKDRSVD